MKSSKVLRTWLVWLTACGAVPLIPAPPAAADEIENVGFSLSRAAAAWGQQEVTVTFSMRDLPADARLLGFGFSFGFNASQITFTHAQVVNSSRFDIYVLDNTRLGDRGMARIEVFYPHPTPVADGDVLTLTFVPGLDLLTELGTNGIATLLLPVTLIPGNETWIYVEGHQPLFPVRNLDSGGIDLWGLDAVHFGEAEGARGSAVVLPIALTNVSLLSSLTVGVDYDEDMLEVLSFQPADEIRAGITDYSIAGGDGMLVLSMDFTPEFCENSAARRTVALVTFWVKAGVKPGVRIGLGPMTFADSKVQGSGHTILLADGGVVVVTDNPVRFLRGDVNGNGVVDTSDPVALLSHLFGTKRRVAFDCPDASDANDDGKVDLSDALSLLHYVFRAGARPRPPFPNPDIDPTYDVLPECSRLK